MSLQKIYIMRQIIVIIEKKIYMINIYMYVFSLIEMAEPNE